MLKNYDETYAKTVPSHEQLDVVIFIDRCDLTCLSDQYHGR